MSNVLFPNTNKMKFLPARQTSNTAIGDLPLKFKLQNYWSLQNFTFMKYKSTWKLIFLQIFWVPREIHLRFCSKTQWQMFLLVFPTAMLVPTWMGTYLASHTWNHYKFPHISYLRISRLIIIAVIWIIARIFAVHIYLLSFPKFWTFSIERFWSLFWYGVILKTSSWLDKT